MRYRYFAQNLAASAFIIGTLAGPQILFGAPQEPVKAQTLSPIANERYRHFRDRGRANMAAERYREAIPDLRAAYELLPGPRILYNIAVAYQSLKEFPEALDYWEKCRDKLSDDDPMHREAEQAIEAMKAMIEKQKATQEIARTELELTRTKSEMERKLNSRRPRWRLGVGAGLTAVGGLVIGFGVPALAIDSRCIDSPMSTNGACGTLYDTQSLGAALTAVGAGLAFSGILMMAWPPSREAAGPSSVKSASSLALSALEGFVR